MFSVKCCIFAIRIGGLRIQGTVCCKAIWDKHTPVSQLTADMPVQCLIERKQLSCTLCTSDNSNLNAEIGQMTTDKGRLEPTVQDTL